MGISSSLGSSALLPAGLGFRNVLINGDMQVSQRSAVGTAVTGITTGGCKTADRWDLNMTTFGTWSQTCIADAPTGSGLRNSLKMACTSAYASPAAGNEMQIRQKLEGQNIQVFRKGTSSAKTFVLSFWVKSFQTGTFICELEDQDNSRNVSASYTVLASGVWEQKFITFPADSTGQFDNDSNSSLAVIWWIGAGSNFTSGTLATTWATPTTANRAVGQTNVASSTSNYWQITGVQLEANLQPTPFEQRPIGVELALCQRYYFRYYGVSGGYSRFSSTGGSYSNTSWQGVLNFPTTMRATPSTIEFSGVGCTDNLSFDSTAFSSVTFSATNTHPNGAFVVGTGGTNINNGVGHILMGRGGATAYIGFSAEL
jgi:hypothetical protein